MRNAIGFDTPSKASLQKEFDSQREDSQVQASQSVDLGKLKKETIERLSNLGSLICDDGFSEYQPQQRLQILMDFAYYSKVADSIL